MMTFDIQQRVFTPDGEYLEDAAFSYREALMERFAASLEGQEVVGQGGTVGWADTFMDFGIGYLGVTPPAMTPAHVQEILFQLFPRKVSAAPGSGPEVVQELQAFWRFLQREFGLATAAAILRLLTPALGRRLDKEMQNPANFGMAKSFMTLGLARGFDMTTPEGAQAWVESYNAELRAEPGPAPVGLPAAAGRLGPPARSGRGTKGEVARRKMTRASQRKNRKKT